MNSETAESAPNATTGNDALAADEPARTAGPIGPTAATAGADINGDASAADDVARMAGPSGADGAVDNGALAADDVAAMAGPSVTSAMNVRPV